MGRPRKSDNNMSRDSSQDWTYVHKHSAIYNTLQLLIDLEAEKVSYQEEVVDPIHALSFCNLDHEYNQDVITTVVSNIRAGRPHGEWLAPVVIVVFPGDERRVVLGHEHLQVARLLGFSAIGVQVVENVDIEQYRINLPAIVPEHLADDPHCRVVSREIIDGDFEYSGYSDDTRKTTIAYTLQMLRLQQMYEASGFTIAQARAEIDKLDVPREFSWSTFDDKFEELASHVVDLKSVKAIKGAFHTDPHMDKRKGYSAWIKLLDQRCFDLRLLSAARGQAGEMQKHTRFTGARARSDKQYKSEKDLIDRLALRYPEENGQPISPLGLARIAVLSGVNPANMWLWIEHMRGELEFARVVGLLSNAQPAVMTPPVAQAAIENYERARDSFDRKDRDADDMTALMLIDLMARTCEIPEFMKASERVLKTREPAVIGLTGKGMPSGLVVKPIFGFD